MPLHPALGGDVLKDEIEDASGGEAHDAGCPFGLVLQEKVPQAGCQRTEKADREKGRKRATGPDSRCGDLPEGVEAFRQVLRGYKGCEQHAHVAVVSEYCPHGSRFGNEIHEHGHELGLAASGSADPDVQKTKGDPSEAKGEGKAYGIQHGDSPRDKSQGYRRDQNPSPQGHDPVDELLLSGCFSRSLAEPQDAAEESGEAREPGQSEDENKLIHRVASLILSLHYCFSQKDQFQEPSPRL